VHDVGDDKSRCECMNRTTLGLPCTCQLSKTVSAKAPICLDAIHIHWKRLSLDEVDLVQEGVLLYRSNSSGKLYRYKICFFYDINILVIKLTII
jgi:hypothetical protein